MDSDKLLMGITERDLANAKEKYGLNGNDEFARYQSFHIAAAEKINDLMAQEFGEKTALYHGLNMAMELLEEFAIYRTDEAIQLSEAYPYDATSDEGDTYRFEDYIYTIPALWQDTEEEPAREIIVNGILTISLDDGAPMPQPCLVISDSLHGAELAAKALLRQICTAIEDGSPIRIIEGLTMGTTKHFAPCKDSKEKTFAKLLGETCANSDAPMPFHIGYSEVLDSPMMLLHNLESVDPLLKACVNNLRHPRSGKKAKLSDEEIKGCLARYNYEGTPEWIQKIMNDKVAFLGQAAQYT